MKNKPFLLRPSGKDYLWGGRRLNDEFAKNIEMYPLAETWECSTHPDGPSYVVSGNYRGLSLKSVLEQHPDYLGENVQTKGELPILIKFIDAKKDLSVQVHPTDEYAEIHENGQLGKTEMWYVLDATRDAKLVYGLANTIEKDKIRRSIETGKIEKYLQKVPVKKDDVFFIEAGTIHAIGSGVLIAEIQENSNLTYRLYDYNRVDKNGKKRELHVDKALEVAELTRKAEPVQPLRILKYQPGMALELLSRCKYFEVYRMIVNSERRQEVYYQSDEMGYRVLLCIGGCGILTFDDEMLNVYKGDCIFIPASSCKIRLHGQMSFLDVRG
jgi:mannose-6-phosphate isomerase